MAASPAGRLFSRAASVTAESVAFPSLPVAREGGLMDRNAALDILESALLSGRDEADPLLADAVRALDGDDDSQLLLRQRTRDDERIAGAMRDVPVPQGT